jgi:uncharacterized protein YecE (DUF72 family)
LPTGLPAKRPERVTARVGVAGWSIPASSAALFPATGSHLERYAAVFNAVEINSSFYREHRVATWDRWGRTVPAEFRFSAKIPRDITHARRLIECEPLIERFVAGPAALGVRAGPLLLQMPPRLAFDAGVVTRFLDTFRRHWAGPLVAEPRHASWFDGEGDALLARFGVGRVAADPAVVPAAAEPGGSAEVVYWRLHGSPRVYYSAYPPAFLADAGARLAVTARSAREVWCILDNTAQGAAAPNALAVLAGIRAARTVEVDA